MTRNMKRFDRRRFLGLAGAATVAGLAGCTNDGDGDSEDGNETDGGNDTEEDSGGNEGENESGEDGDESDEDGNGTEDDNETEDDGNESENGTANESEEASRAGIRLIVENENGEPVAQGVSITIDPAEEMENGTMLYTVESEEALEGGEYEQPIDPGDYLITAEGDAFETVEREVTVEEGETTEVTLTLEGAPAEGEANETESGEAEENETANESADNETANESEGDGNESTDARNETANETGNESDGDEE